ncbi:MAG: ABC transporter ATP-binding protein [Bacteroidia bacterium]
MQLSIQNLSKVYPNGVKALHDFNLEIGQGMFGLLGPNGAGKSSLMRTIATLQKPDQGSIIFNEIDVLHDKMAIRKRLGYLPQEFGVYPRVSAERLLDYMAKLKGIGSKQDRRKRIARCLEITNLTEVSSKHVSGYSGGMKQRFGIAQLLLNDPQLIIVDEPTAGLDPAERQRFLNILREISTQAVVIFSTHIVEDIKELCTDMAIMNQGRVLTHASPEQAISQLAGQVWCADIERSALAEYENKYALIAWAYNRDNSLRVRVLSESRPREYFRPAPAGLEDVYLAHLYRTQVSLPSA